MEEMVVVTPEKLEKLMKQKLEAAGLHSEHAEEVARHLTFADASGIHSHGAVRMDYHLKKLDRPLPFFMAIMAWVNLFVTKH